MTPIATRAGLLLLCAGAPDGSPELELHQGTLEIGGEPVSTDFGRLLVPQRHDRGDAGRIELRFLRLHSMAEHPEPPVVFLNGLPGGATEMRDRDWRPLLAHQDLILLDQRGTGTSRPRLFFGGPDYHPEKIFGNRGPALAEVVEAAAAAAAELRRRGIDPAAFNTRESARDLEDLRQALGVERICLLAHSSGTHLAQEYLRRHSAHVARYASLGTVGMHDIHKLPGELDESLERIGELVAADEETGPWMPDFYGAVEEVLSRLEEAPLPVPVVRPQDGSILEVPVGRFGLQLILVIDLADPADLARFPRLIASLEARETDVLQPFLQKRFEMFQELPLVLFCQRGSSGAGPDRWKRIFSQAERSPFGTVRNLFSPDVDRALGLEDLGEGFRAPVHSDVKTLFVSGTLDAHTPPSQAEAVRRGFPDSRHLILVNGGHDDVLFRPEAARRVVAFLGGEEVDVTPIELPAPTFLPLSLGED
jgi:pimeloyl-ACP methyl ester carboxylesterase